MGSSVNRDLSQWFAANGIRLGQMSYQHSTRVILHPWYLLLLELHLLFPWQTAQSGMFLPFKALAHFSTIFMAHTENVE